MKKFMLILMLMVVLSVSLSAEGEGQNSVNATELFRWTIICGTVALAAAAIGGAFAQSNALRTAMENIGRNPAAADAIRGILIIGLALIESLVIYVLLIDFIIFMVKWGAYTVG